MQIVPLELDTHFAEGTVNAFLAIGKTTTLIDAGNPGKESFQQLKTKLHQHNVSLNDLDSIVLTHTHIDHAGGIPWIQEEADVSIYVHELARPSIHASKQDFARDMAFFRDFMEQCGADPFNHMVKRAFKEQDWRNVRYVKEGHTIPIAGENFEVVHVPGHSQVDILLWNPETGDAFAGDHLIKAFSVNAFIEPPFSGSDIRPRPLLLYRNSLAKICRLPLKMVYPGHGDTFDEHRSLIQKRLQEQEKRCESILSILSNGTKCIYEICTEMYPRLKNQAVFLGLSQIQGHLDLLEERKLVSAERRGKLLIYQRI